MNLSSLPLQQSVWSLLFPLVPPVFRMDPSRAPFLLRLPVHASRPPGKPFRSFQVLAIRGDLGRETPDLSPKNLFLSPLLRCCFSLCFALSSVADVSFFPPNRYLSFSASGLMDFVASVTSWTPDLRDALFQLHAGAAFLYNLAVPCSQSPFV